MKTILFVVSAYFLLTSIAYGQSKEVAQVPHAAQSAAPTSPAPAQDDVEQLRSDLQRLKVLLNQMRTNLAFVDTSQSPLKHQFELEADAWQVIVEQMDRRLSRMEQRNTHP